MGRQANQGDLCSRPGSGAERDCRADHQREMFTEAISPAETPQETAGTCNCHKQDVSALPHPQKAQNRVQKERETWKRRLDDTAPTPSRGSRPANAG